MFNLPIFAVPTVVVDKYLKLAGGNNLKVLLFMLRHGCGDPELSSDEIAAGTGLSAEIVSDALLFWEQVEAEDFSAPTPTSMTISSSSDKSTKSENPAGTVNDEKSIAATVRKTALERTVPQPPKAIAASLKDSPDVQYLFERVEKLQGHTLNHTMQSALVTITDEIGFPASVAVMMADYCAEIGKLTPAYMKTVAADWTEREIITLEDAGAEIARLRDSHTLLSELKRLFEYPKPFSGNDKVLIKKWSEEYGFSAEMMHLAYQEMLEYSDKVSLKYTDKILAKWHADGILTPEAAESGKKAWETMKKAKKDTEQGKESPSFDLSAW
ncbi:hypothetical protein FACS189499_02320 [Clostridia bacterium]|nr:hypothetical protein FACS189499_02320 [Clostridia bacterium]